MLCAEVQNLAPLILWGQERRKVVPMGAAAPTDGKQVLSAAGSPEGSRPFGKVSPQGRWEFPGKLPYLVWHISLRLNALLRCAGHFKAWTEGT